MCIGYERPLLPGQAKNVRSRRSRERFPLLIWKKVVLSNWSVAGDIALLLVCKDTPNARFRDVGWLSQRYYRQVFFPISVKFTKQTQLKSPSQTKQAPSTFPDILAQLYFKPCLLLNRPTHIILGTLMIMLKRSSTQRFCRGYSLASRLLPACRIVTGQIKS